MRRFRFTDPDFEMAFCAFVDERRETPEEVDAVVRDIIAAVRAEGLAALLRFAKDFDGVALDELSIRVSEAEIDAGAEACPPAVREAIAFAAERIRSYHARQRPADLRFTDDAGVELGWRWTPLESVGIYVPGGRAAYPSTVLMNAVPAKVAGVRDVIMVSPNPDALVLAAAALAGVDRVIGIGGAHAVAALAYGTRSIPRVDKIVGPGNAYVAEAKRQVFGGVGIDMIAGPSEILVISDGAAPVEWLAMDLFSQAEHDEDAQALLLSPDRAHLDAVEKAIGRLLGDMPRKRVIAASLKARGALIETRDLEEACALASRIAPEHLELCVAEPQRWLAKIKNAGAIFLGSYSSEAIGDYCAGPNHVLPTSGSARFSSPLGVYDFQKRSSIIEVSRAAAATLGRIAATLADGEGLSAHARAARMRIGK